MARNSLRNAASVTALAAALAAPAAIAADVYRVAARISHGDAVIAEPVMLVDGNAPASVRVTADDPYELSVHVAPVDDGTGVEVKTHLSTSHGRVSSTVTTAAGRPVSVATGDIGLELTVTPSSK